MVTEPTANILVVDDDVKTLTAMEALLSGPGRNIVKAASGQEALRWLLRQDFALILLDVRLPEMDGFETAELIRQNERFRYTPIIFLSAIDTLESDVFRGVASGAVDYLFKPVVSQVLQAKVSVFVDLFRMNEKLKHQALRQSEERFRLVIESLQDYAVFMMDPEGRVASWNLGAERILGWQQDEVIRQWFENFYPPDSEPAAARALQEAVSGGRYEEEGWRIRKDGSRFWANMVVTALLDDNGKLIGFSAITRDLTNRKRAEEELRKVNAELERRYAEQGAQLVAAVGEREQLQEQLLQAQKLESIGTLAGGVAHDFNNLLNVISGYAGSIQQNANGQIAESAGVIQETVKRGASLVQQLLAMARKSTVVFEHVEINPLMERLAPLLKETFPKTIEVILDVQPNLPPVMADPNQITQATLNLCLNARDAMPGGGKLLLSTAVISGAGLRRAFQEAWDEYYACITVRDTGTGMDEATKNRIFEPFFTTKQQGEGTGLGLAVTYGIVRSHRGFIEVESEPDQGSSFRLCLPILEGKAEARDSKRALQERQTQRLAGTGEAILFAEDEVRQLRLMQTFLESAGYRVFAARDGLEAVETLRRHRDEIKVAVLDLGLPKLNGWEAFRKMKEISPSIKAIFATGFMAPQIESQLNRGELSGVILKPYQLDEVLEKIALTCRDGLETCSGSGAPDHAEAAVSLPAKIIAD
ncbi:MAG: ATP-binding response regulator [Candidatus Binatia bacterium]